MSPHLRLERNGYPDGYLVFIGGFLVGQNPFKVQLTLDQ